MANYSFSSSKTNLTLETLRQAIEEINTRRFKGLLKVEPCSPALGEQGFLVSYGEWAGTSIWLFSKRRVALRGGTIGFACWVRYVFHAELAQKFEGMCSGEAGGGPWKPEPDRYSLESFLYVPYDDEFVPDPEKQSLAELPAELRSL